MTEAWLKWCNELDSAEGAVAKETEERAWYMYPYVCYAARRAKDGACPVHPDHDPERKHVSAAHQTKLISLGSALFKGSAFNQKEFPV